MSESVVRIVVMVLISIFRAPKDSRVKEVRARKSEI